MAPSAKMLFVVNLNRNFPGQGQTDDTGSHISFSPAITRAAITGSQFFQHGFITDNVKDITFIVGDIYGKACTGNKLIKFSNLSGCNFQKIPVLLQPNCQFLGLQSTLQEIAGVIRVHPELPAALM